MTRLLNYVCTYFNVSLVDSKNCKLNYPQWRHVTSHQKELTSSFLTCNSSCWSELSDSVPRGEGAGWTHLRVATSGCNARRRLTESIAYSDVVGHSDDACVQFISLLASQPARRKLEDMPGRNEVDFQSLLLIDIAIVWSLLEATILLRAGISKL